MTMAEPIEICQCEACESEHPIEQMTMMEDCWFCPACVAAFKNDFDACAHRWAPHINTMGESGWYCERCSGFVNDDYFPVEAYIGELP